MPFAAALSTLKDSTRALDEACTQALAGLGGTPDLALLFFSRHHARSARELAGAGPVPVAGALVAARGPEPLPPDAGAHARRPQPAGLARRAAHRRPGRVRP